MNGNGKLHPAWITTIGFIIIQAIAVTVFAATNNAKTNRNQDDIKELRQDQKDLSEKIFNELKEIRKDINK